MKELSSEEHLEFLKCLLLGSLISADNDEYPEDVKQEIMVRMKECPEDWPYIFEPLDKDAEKYVKLMNSVYEGVA